jgi:hypothetical protein
MPRRTAPPELGPAGRELWAWLTDNFTITGAEPLASELCAIVDRLAQVREAIKAAGLSGAAGRSLLNAEVKLSGQLMRIWRTLGLADPPAKGKRI